jgi:hypothetical protein
LHRPDDEPDRADADEGQHERDGVSDGEPASTRHAATSSTAQPATTNAMPIASTTEGPCSSLSTTILGPESGSRMIPIPIAESIAHHTHARVTSRLLRRVRVR